MKNKLIRYTLSFWEGANDQEGRFKEIECLISSETREKILSDPPKFISILIDDGEELIIVTDNINHLKQIFDKTPV